MIFQTFLADEITFPSKLDFELFHFGGLYHIETSPLICRANQWTGFYMIGISVIKEFKLKMKICAFMLS